MPKLIDLTGKQFNLFTVLKRVDNQNDAATKPINKKFDSTKYKKII